MGVKVKKYFRLFFIIFIFSFLISCPNEMMRDLVEQKLSDPVADTFVINSGAPTASLEVTLNSKVTKDNDALQMRFRNEGGSWSDWASYSDSASWTLPIGDGTKTVYAEYRDEGHNVVGMQSNIVLNTGAPAGDFYVWGSAVSGNRHLYVNSTSVTLCMTISNVASMRFSNTSDAGPWSSWIPYSSTTPWTLTGDGSKTIYAEFQTNAGTTTPSSRNITLDTTPPSVTGFVINNGLATANSTSAELDYNYTEANNLWVQYMNDGGSWSSQEALAAGSAVPVNKSWALRAATGTRTVSARLADIAGNISSVSSDDIYLNTVAPASPEVTIASFVNTLRPAWSWPAVTGASQYRMQLDTTTGTWNNIGNVLSWSPDYDLSTGTHVLYVQAGDIAGNWSDTASAGVIIDLISPSVVLTSNQSDSFVKDSDTVLLTATFSDLNGINESPGPRISIGSLILNTSMTKVNNLVWIYSWNVPAGNDGNVSITINASDAAGNTNTAATGSTLFTIDNTAPASPVVSGELYTTDTTPTWSWPAVSGASRYRWAWTAGGPYTEIGGDLTFTPAGILSAGLHTLYVQSGDTAGNWSVASGSYSITVFSGSSVFDNSGTLGSQLYGARSAGTESVGAGQTVLFSSGMTLKNFGYYFTSGFGDNVVLRLDMRNGAGTIVTSRTVSVPSSFTGGWVYWTGINYAVSSSSTYIFTSFVTNAIGTTNTSSIRAEVGGDFLSASYSCTGLNDTDLITWSNWGVKTAEWDFWYRAYGD
jgi:hypothetical protein